MELKRVPIRRYEDPLDAIWLATARALGLTVRRSPEAYASTDGAGTLVLGTPDTLDPDDSLAQMIFHEMCHALVQGEGAFERPDWGLDNTSDRDTPREHATLRLQAFLAGRHGLRAFFAPTTDYRAFWNGLGDDPFLPRHDPSVTQAIQAMHRAARSPWSPHLDDALRATAAIARETAGITARLALRGGEASVGRGLLPSLWTDVAEPAGEHPTGLPLSRVPGRTCGGCGWVREVGAGKRLTCRQADDQRIDAAWPACERWEDALDCLTCGACCRSAYDMVMVSARDPFRQSHPELVVQREDHAEVLRAGDRCAALQGGARGETLEGFQPYTCAVYEDRPKTCRDFARGGMHCLIARRKVGLSL